MSGVHDAFEALSVSSTAIGCTTTKIAGRDHAHATLKVAAIVIRYDGTNPTATVGDDIEIGDTFKISGVDELQKIRFIRRDAANATLNLHYGRES